MDYNQFGTFQNNEATKNEIKTLYQNIGQTITKKIQWKHTMSTQNISLVYENCLEIEKHLSLNTGLNISMIYNRLNIIQTLLNNELTPEFGRFDKFDKSYSNKKSITGLLKYLWEILEKSWIDIATLDTKEKVHKRKTISSFRDKEKYSVEKIIYLNK